MKASSKVRKLIRKNRPGFFAVADSAAGFESPGEEEEAFTGNLARRHRNETSRIIAAQSPASLLYALATPSPRSASSRQAAAMPVASRPQVGEQFAPLAVLDEAVGDAQAADAAGVEAECRWRLRARRCRSRPSGSLLRR